MADIIQDTETDNWSDTNDDNWYSYQAPMSTHVVSLPVQRSIVMLTVEGSIGS
jgi:hypothetical protein